MADKEDFKYNAKKIAEMHALEEAYRMQDALKREWEEGGSREDYAEAFESYLSKLRGFVEDCPWEMMDVHSRIGTIVRERAQEHRRHAERMREIEDDAVLSLRRFVTSQDYV